MIILACFPSVSIYIRKSHVFFLLLAATEPPSIPQLPSLFLEFFEKVIGMYFFRNFSHESSILFTPVIFLAFLKKARNITCDNSRLFSFSANLQTHTHTHTHAHKQTNNSILPEESRHVHVRYPCQIKFCFSLHGGDIARSK